MKYLHQYLDIAGLQVKEIVTIEESEITEVVEPSCKYLQAVAVVCSRVHKAVLRSLEQGMLPVCIGGDHSLAIGSAAGASGYLAGRNEALGLIWADAHIDINTQKTSPSGNVHGMALAALLGLGEPILTNIGIWGQKVQRSHTLAVGLRFADKAELVHLNEEGPHVVSMRTLDAMGIGRCLEGNVPRVLAGTGGLHLSLDLDVLDPALAPGVNTPFPGGMSFRELRVLCETVAATGRLVSLDIVEHNPEKNFEDLMLPIMGELIACTLGASAMP